MSLKENKDLFITRKRKKWKFAHFDSYANCFSFARNDSAKNIYQAIFSYLPRSERGKQRRVVLEIAAGNAQFSLELARRYPEYDFVAVDIKSDRLYTSAKKALEEKVENIAFLRMHLSDLHKVFAENSVDELWLTFPDPYPKERSAKHRLSHKTFLQQYRKILKDTGSLKFKTDNRDLFLWSLEQFVAEKWYITELSFDLHESDLPDEYKIKTYYEQKFTAQGIPTQFCVVTEKT